MKRSEAIAAFDTYVDQFDRDNPMIYQKAVHSHKVAEIAERIARSLGQEKLVDFAWLLGLLHDIGRFEQVKQYGTFADSQSVDHAELGADILFKDGLIEAFPTGTLPEGWQNTAETAIRQHNKLALSDGLDEYTRTLSNILRDADKVDIFRVLIELSYADRGGGRKPDHPESCELSPEVMKCVKEHRCVPSHVRKTSFDRRVSHCCLAFELVYEESRQITREQGYLQKLLSMQDEDGVNVRNERQLLQLAMVEEEIERAWSCHGDGSFDTLSSSSLVLTNLLDKSDNKLIHKSLCTEIPKVNK